MVDNFPFPYYCDASAPDDNGDGSSALPKKYWRSILTPSFNNRQGQAFLLRPGRFYDVKDPGGGMGQFLFSHITVKPWDNGESGNPCLDGRNWIAPNTNLFTPEAPSGDGTGYVWSITVGTQQPVLRVFAASQNNGVLLSQRTIGEGLGTTSDLVADDQTQILNALNARDCWHGCGTGTAKPLGYKLYMWTPSQFIDPSAYYQGLSFLQHGNGTYGFDIGILITSNATNRAQDITVQDIDILGATGSSISINTNDVNQPVSNIRIERCNGLALVRSGITVRQSPSTVGMATGRSVVSDVTIRNCTMDGTLSAKEEERTRDYSHFTIADMYVIFDRVDNVVVERCKAINARHTAFAMGNYSASSTWTRRSGFRNCTAVASAANTYARAFAISMTDDACFVDQCTFDGMNVGSQAIGSVLLTDNVHKNARPSSRVTGTDTADGHISIYSFIVDRETPNIGNERYIVSYPVNLRMYGCSFGPLPSKTEPMVTIAAFKNGTAPVADAPFPNNTVFLRNNLLLDTDPNRRGKPFLLTKVDNGLTLGDIVFENNLVFKGDGQPTVTYRGTTTNINGTAGFAANLTIDPVVDSQMRPLYGSPLVAAAVGTGMTRRDNTGRQRPARDSIGAFEDFSSYNRSKRA